MNLRCGTQLVKVRLYCIDAPEMAQKPWGTRSREHLQSITPATVRLLKIDQDQYGRTVGEIYTTDAEPRLLNLEHGRSRSGGGLRAVLRQPALFQRRTRGARRQARHLEPSRRASETLGLQTSLAEVGIRLELAHKRLDTPV
jgi:hypothetical protein